MTYQLYSCDLDDMPQWIHSFESFSTSLRIWSVGVRLASIVIKLSGLDSALLSGLKGCGSSMTKRSALLSACSRKSLTFPLEVPSSPELISMACSSKTLKYQYYFFLRARVHTGVGAYVFSALVPFRTFMFFFYLCVNSSILFLSSKDWNSQVGMLLCCDIMCMLGHANSSGE